MIKVANYDHAERYFGPRILTLDFVCDGSGEATVESVDCFGYVHQCIFSPGTVATNLDFTLTTASPSFTIWQESNISNGKHVHPRVLEQGTDGADLATRTRHFHAGMFSLAVTGGTSGDTGSVTVFLVPA